MAKAPQMATLKAALVKATMRKQIAIFFTEMCREEPDWPHVEQEQLVEGIADALIDMGTLSGTGVAMLQTLVYELQERVNAHMKSTGA